MAWHGKPNVGIRRIGWQCLAVGTGLMTGPWRMLWGGHWPQLYRLKSALAWFLLRLALCFDGLMFLLPEYVCHRKSQWIYNLGRFAWTGSIVTQIIKQLKFVLAIGNVLVTGDPGVHFALRFILPSIRSIQDGTKGLRNIHRTVSASRGSDGNTHTHTNKTK